MAFSDEVQRAARKRAHGVCECSSASCPHFGRCKAPGTDYHHKRSVSAGGDESVTNCQLLCHPCHQRLHDSGGLGRL